MGKLGNSVRWIWSNRVSLAAYSLVVSGILWAIAEYAGWVNLVSINPPYQANSFAQIAGALGSIVLSFALVLLYAQQTEIQENQERLMEQEFKPYLTGEITSLNVVSAQFAIRNSGNATAYHVEAEWSVAGETRSWEIPSLPPGEEYGFPVVVDGDNWLLNTEEIRDYLDENDASTEIGYDIWCYDRFDERIHFDGSVDFGVLSERSEANEIWDEDPLEELSNEVKKIRKDFKKLTRYERNRDRAANWKHRTEQTKILYGLIQEHDEIDKSELNSLTGISEGNVEYRLKALRDIGAIEYDEDRGVATQPPSAGQNRTLDEFIR